MKTMLKLGIAMIIFGLVLAVLGSFALRGQGGQKAKMDGAASAASSASAVVIKSESSGASGVESVPQKK